MLYIFAVVLAIASIWDVFTTIYGTTRILGEGAGQMTAAILFGALIGSSLVNTRSILSRRDDAARMLMSLFWVLSLGYDLYTSYLGNERFLLPLAGDEQIWGRIEEPRFLILLGLTMLVSGSPVLLSLLWDDVFGR